MVTTFQNRMFLDESKFESFVIYIYTSGDFKLYKGDKKDNKYVYLT